MFDITKGVVQVSVARIPMEIVGTGFREHLGERIREHTRSQGVQACFLFCDDGQCLSMRDCDLLCFLSIFFVRRCLAQRHWESRATRH